MVMAGQIEHILATISTGRVIFQVLPLEAGAHAFMGGSATIYTAPDGTEAAYTEGSHTGQLFDDPREVNAFALSYDRLRTRALSEEKSAALLRTMIEEYSNGTVA
jgi:hypothetical protein